MWINRIDFQDTIKPCSLIVLKNNSIKPYGIIACPREKKMRVPVLKKDNLYLLLKNQST